MTRPRCEQCRKELTTVPRYLGNVKNLLCRDHWGTRAYEAPRGRIWNRQEGETHSDPEGVEIVATD